MLSRLTPADLAELTDRGHTVREVGDGTVDVDGNLFKLVGGRRAVDPGSVSVVDAGEVAHADGGDFSIISESVKVNGPI